MALAFFNLGLPEMLILLWIVAQVLFLALVVTLLLLVLLPRSAGRH